MIQSLLDPHALRNLKYFNPILRKSNLKVARFGHFCFFSAFSCKIKQNYLNLASFKLEFLRIGLMYFRFLKACGFGAHSEPKLVSQFMQTNVLCHKMSQNSTIFSVSYYRDCITINQLKNMASHISVPYVRRWYISTFIKWGLFYEKVFVVFVSVCKRYMYRKWNTWFFL